MRAGARGRLRLNRLELQVHLGWPEKERVKPQPVILDLEIAGPALLKAGKSDKLDDTVCYDVLATAIKNHIQDNEYKLVEHLAWDLFEFVTKRLPKKMKIKLVITKPNAPVEGLLGGASFEIEG